MRLETQRLVLREFDGSDLSRTYASDGTDQTERFYQAFDLGNPEQIREFIRHAMETQREEPRRTWDLAVTLKPGGELIGRGGIQRTPFEPREAMVWFISDPRHWGQGYIAEAAEALFGFCFDELRLHRVFGECDPANEGATSLMEKLGMRREATFVEHAWINNRWRDTAIYALLDREWKKAPR